MFVATSAMAQMEVNQVKDSIVWERTGMGASFSVEVMYYEEFDQLTIFYRDINFTTLVSIEHISIGSKENLKQFCELVLKSCETKEDFETSLYHISRYSKKAARVWTTEGAFYMTTKEAQEILDKL